MKNLKKVLAVVLAVAMAFSLMAVASAKQIGDYTDTSDVKYKEAVDLISGLGIMTGTSETTFDPKGTFTREQAAKVICYIMQGSSVASTLTTSTSSFKDVEPTRWSAPYIEYCAANGIINGTGDGNFNPTAPVTGSQMGKLLLTALGYGAKGEYTGSNWEINTIVKAQNLKILDTNVSYSAPATREEVAKYVFNALTRSTCYTVTYNVLTGTYLGTYNIPAGATQQQIEQAQYEAGFGWLTFKLKKIDASGTGIAYPNVTAHYWKAYFGTPSVATVSGVYGDDNIIATSTNGTNLVNLTSATLNGAANPFYKASYDDNVKLYYNGALVSPSGTYIPTPTTYPTVISASQGSAPLNAVADVCGVIVNLIDNDFDGKVDVVSVIEKTVRTVNVVPTVDAAGTVTFIDVPGGPFQKGTIVYPSDLAARDSISTVAFGGSDIVTHVEKNTKITGQVTSTNTTGAFYYTLKFDGKEYIVAQLYGTSGLGLTQLTSASLQNKPSAAWIDSNGYMVALSNDYIAASYGLVTGYLYKDPDGMNLTGSAEIRLYTADGKVAVYPQAVGSNGFVNKLTDTDFNGSFGATPALTTKTINGTTVVNGELVAYTINANGQIASIAPVGTGSTVSSYTAKSGTITIGGSLYFLTQNTQVIYYNSNAAWSIFNPAVFQTGYSATKAISSSTNVKYVLSTVPGAPANQIDAIYFDTAAPTTGGNYAYFVSGGYSMRVVAGVGTYYDYTGFVNGQPTTISTFNSTPFGPGLWTYNVDANGIVVSATNSDPTIANYSGKAGYVSAVTPDYVIYKTGTPTYPTQPTGQITGGTDNAVKIDSNTKFYRVIPFVGVQESSVLPSSTNSVYTMIAAIQFVPGAVTPTAAAIYYMSVDYNSPTLQ